MVPVTANMTSVVLICWKHRSGGVVVATSTGVGSMTLLGTGG